MFNRPGYVLPDTLSHEHDVFTAEHRTVGSSKFNKSDLPNTMVKPKSSWTTRTQPSKTQCYDPGPDVTHTAGPVCVCKYVCVHIRVHKTHSKWQPYISASALWSPGTNSDATAFISLLTSFRWIIVKWVAAVSQLFTQWILDAFVNSFKLSHHCRKETTAWFSEEMRNCRRRMFTHESSGRDVCAKVVMYNKESCW